MAQPNLPAVTAIVVAAGASRRMGFDKLSYRLPDGRTVLETSCTALAAHPAITQLVLVCGGNRAACEAIAAACLKPCAVVQGGATRADSVRNGLAVVTVKRDACSGCFNHIPPQRQADIRLGKKLIVCEYCGRILVNDPEAHE